MGGGKKHGPVKDQPGHGIFAYRTKDDKTWRLHMTMSSVLRTTLEGYSAREWIIMPLVCLSIAGMGILYSLLPDDMTARVIPAEVLEIYESPRTRTRHSPTPLPGRSPTEAGPGQDRSRTNCPRAGPNVG